MDKPDPISTIEKKVNVLMAENKVSAAKLCQSIGMTANGYSKMWKNRSIKVDTIQNIARFFQVPLSHFFPINETSNYNIVGEGNEVHEIREKYILALESENKLLKRLLKDKGND